MNAKLDTYSVVVNKVVVLIDVGREEQNEDVREEQQVNGVVEDVHAKTEVLDESHSIRGVDTSSDNQTISNFHI
jgi:hypothetical protein